MLFHFLQGTETTDADGCCKTCESQLRQFIREKNYIKRTIAYENQFSLLETFTYHLNHDLWQLMPLIYIWCPYCFWEQNNILREENSTFYIFPGHTRCRGIFCNTYLMCFSFLLGILESKCNVQKNSTFLVSNGCISSTPVDITSCAGLCGTSSMWVSKSESLITKYMYFLCHATAPHSMEACFCHR